MSTSSAGDGGAEQVRPLALRRRQRGQSRIAVLDAARELFARYGYDRTTLREIAEYADVNESVIFRQFRTKAALFREAIMGPYHDWVSSFVSSWEATEPVSNEDMMRGFIGGLFDMLTEHREIVLALVAAHAFSEAKVLGEGGPALSDELDRLAEQTLSEAQWRGFIGFDMKLAVRFVFGVVLSLVVLDEWLMPTGPVRPSRDHMVSEMTAFALNGVERNKPNTNQDTESIQERLRP